MSLQLKLIGAFVTLFWLGASVWMYGSSQYAKGAESVRMTYAHAIDTQKIEAAKTLAIETEKTQTLTDTLYTAKNQQELQDAKHKSVTDTLTRDLRAAAGPGGRLRDPNAAGCGRGSDSAPGDVASAASDRADDGAEAGGFLSIELTALLSRLGAEADAVNLAYTSCRADAYSVRGEALP